MPELVFFSGTMDCGKSTLALQIEHNRSTRGLQGMIFSRDDRAGHGKLSSRLGLVTEAVEVVDDLDLYVHVVESLSSGGRVDYVIIDEAQFLAPARSTNSPGSSTTSNSTSSPSASPPTSAASSSPAPSGWSNSPTG